MEVGAPLWFGCQVVRSHDSPGRVCDVVDINLAGPRMNWATRENPIRGRVPVRSASGYK